MATTNQYKKAYEQFGEERKQEEVPKGLVEQAVVRRRFGPKKTDGPVKSHFDQFWGLRRDLAWAEIPGQQRWDRKLRKRVFVAMVTDILIHLAPQSIFNPMDLWSKECEAERLALLGDAQKEKKAKQSKDEIIKAENSKRIAEKKIVDEVTRIRNMKLDAELPSLLSSMRTKEGRLVLMIELLKKAYDAGEKEKDKIFEALWAIEEFGLTEFNAPAPTNDRDITNKRDSSLVYDSYSTVESLLKKVRKLREKEKDMIRLQLMDMSDSLPPLSKFSTGFKLDPWQRRAIKWIDAGRSLVICAPTSSGKTVLSGYVALINKSATTKGDAGAAEVSDRNRSTAGNGADVDGDVGGEAMDDVWDAEGSGDEGDGDDGEDYSDDGEDKEQGENDADDQEDGPASGSNHHGVSSVDAIIAKADRVNRLKFRRDNSDGTQRVLFVVPSEPLVWQVAAYLTRLLRVQGDSITRVALVTDQMTYNPLRVFNVMPQIVVGTPAALESALTKPRGTVGRFEHYKKSAGDILPGGFDHFDWAIFDEVHALDGEEGEALQRLIRAMPCKFLALSATVGNSDQLRGWLERVKGDQLLGVECVDAADDDVTLPPPPPPKTIPSNAVAVKIERTLEKCSVVIEHIASDLTVGALKHLIAERWPSVTFGMQQLQFDGKDLHNDDATLESYGMFSSSSSSSTASASAAAEPVVVVPTVYLNSHVNIISHQVRFINLQRYVWTNGQLKLLSPLAAVESIDDLRSGILSQSSLSMTPRDSYILWEALQKLFPATVITAADPHNFFAVGERITLQRTKEYEDHLKHVLADLAKDYPLETHELLHHFSLQDPSKEFDLCDLALDLKNREMLPCLMFHLNPFEAIRLFQTLLAGLEWRQKRDHPTYYRALVEEKAVKQKDTERAIQNTGKNKKALEEAERAGEVSTVEQDFTVDPFEPHPAYRFCKGAVMSTKEWGELCARMEKEDGFNNRDFQAINEKPGENEAVLRHALMRGLRRGIGLYIKEVSSPAYRREVQRLASKGKLAVVVSDDSLAFGVNMPFRTCVFCGEMNGELTPLMAQQMSGRAGRRGLDTQGNLVYAGSRASFIRSLMMGKVSDITGSAKPPRYESLFLQPMLSTRYVGWGRGEVIGGRTLEEYCAGPDTPLEVPSYTLTYSKQSLVDLRLVEQTGEGGWQPNELYESTHALLSMVWELRGNLPESITLGQLLPELCRFMEPEQSNFSEKKNQERILVFVSSFFSVLLQLIDRREYKQRVLADGSIDPDHKPLHEHSYFSQLDRKQLIDDWADKFKSQQEGIPEHLAHLRSPVPPGTPLDDTLFQCMLDRGYMFTLSDAEKQDVKIRFWNVGNTLRVMHNTLWPHEEYFDVLEVILRSCFKHILYLNAEFVRGLTNFDDVSSMDRETRSDLVGTAPRPPQAIPWVDTLEDEPPRIFPVPWTDAISRGIDRFKDWKQSNSTASESDVNEELGRITGAFCSLRPGDKAIIRLGANFTDAAVAAAVASSGPARGTKLQAIGVLCWVYLRLRPSTSKWPFFGYLKALYEMEAEPVDEAAIKAWHKKTGEISDDAPELSAIAALTNRLSGASIGSSIGAPAAPAGTYLPSGTDITAEELSKLRENSNSFVQWLDEEEEDDDEEEEED